MEAEFQSIERILEIYLARSKAALDALASEDWDRFDSAIRWRNAAFHNFRAADHVARLQRSDYLSLPGLQQLGQNLQETDLMLTQAIEKQRDRLNQKLIKMSRNRARISKFHSGLQDQSGFQKTV